MLKLDTNERISSKDIHKLSFFQNKNKILNLNEECVLNKPKEMVFIPYINPNITTGIKKIRNFYYIF